MKRFFTVLLLTAAMAFAPVTGLTQQQPQNTTDQKASKPGVGSAKSGGGCCPNMGKMMGQEDWKAKHEKMKQDMAAMDKKLDDLVAAMNSTTGDQKVAAMSNVINELVSQRKQMMEMFKSSHGKMAGMKGPCPGCPMMEKDHYRDGKMHRHQGARHEKLPGPSRTSGAAD